MGPTLGPARALPGPAHSYRDWALNFEKGSSSTQARDRFLEKGLENWDFYVVKITHTSKINDLRSSLNSEEMLQNFLYLYKKKTQVIFFVFHFEQLSFFPL